MIVIDLDGLTEAIDDGTHRATDGEVRALLRIVRAAQVLDRALHPTPASRGEKGMGMNIADYDGPGAIKCKALLHEALKAVK